MPPKLSPSLVAPDRAQKETRRPEGNETSLPVAPARPTAQAFPLARQSPRRLPRLVRYCDAAAACPPPCEDAEIHICGRRHSTSRRLGGGGWLPNQPGSRRVPPSPPHRRAFCSPLWSTGASTVLRPTTVLRSTPGRSHPSRSARVELLPPAAAEWFS